MSARHARQGGFTLVEAVLVILITGIVSGMLALFIRMPVQNYVDSANRAQLTDAADLALRRMARDIRLAVPNSVRPSADNAAVEFLLTKAGGRYWDQTDPVAGNFLDFSNAADLLFDVVGSMPASPQNIVPGDAIVVYNLGPDVAQADAYCGTCNRATVSAVNGNQLTLASNPFAAQNPSMTSPGRRFQVVSSPVSYVCSSINAGGTGRLTRYWAYPIALTQSVPPTGGKSAILVDNVYDCLFSYTNLKNVRSGLVGLTLTLQAPVGSGERITLMHQIHVDNTP